MAMDLPEPAAAPAPVVAPPQLGIFVRLWRALFGGAGQATVETPPAAEPAPAREPGRRDSQERSRGRSDGRYDRDRFGRERNNRGPRREHGGSSSGSGGGRSRDASARPPQDRGSRNEAARHAGPAEQRQERPERDTSSHRIATAEVGGTTPAGTANLGGNSGANPSDASQVPSSPGAMPRDSAEPRPPRDASDPRGPRPNRPPRADRPEDGSGEQRRSRRGGRRRGRGRGRNDAGGGSFEGSASQDSPAREPQSDGGGAGSGDAAPASDSSRQPPQRSFDLSAERGNQENGASSAPRSEAPATAGESFQPRESTPAAGPGPSAAPEAKPVKVWTSSPAPTSGSFGGDSGGRNDRE